MVFFHVEIGIERNISLLGYLLNESHGKASFVPDKTHKNHS